MNIEIKDKSTFDSKDNPKLFTLCYSQRVQKKTNKNTDMDNLCFSSWSPHVQRAEIKTSIGDILQAQKE